MAYQRFSQSMGDAVTCCCPAISVCAGRRRQSVADIRLGITSAKAFRCSSSISARGLSGETGRTGLLQAAVGRRINHGSSGVARFNSPRAIGCSVRVLPLPEGTGRHSPLLSFRRIGLRHCVDICTVVWRKIRWVEYSGRLNKPREMEVKTKRTKVGRGYMSMTSFRCAWRIISSIALSTTGGARTSGAARGNSNSGRRTLDLLRVRRASEARVDLLPRLVQGGEPLQQVVARRVVVRAALVVGEVLVERGAQQFLGEEVDFVQEQDLRGVGGWV